ncbi:IS66 family insertion sequence element accessory protein TnpB, partial [Komagataeibacter rhaeticus]|uniref:IS66 family insertion sequence element accessory protein TnpB n=1 Tax=Komagataeibacter rhaeticus TaxID=215221 RepID=UPI001427B39F
GLSLYAKRIERGHFLWPSAKDGAIHLSPSQLTCLDGAIHLSPSQLTCLLEGVDWRNPQKTWRPELAG